MIISNEISFLPTTIAGVSASIVAILGGFIASRLIAINSERCACQSMRVEIKFEKQLRTDERNLLHRSIDEADAIFYIHSHMEELISGVDLHEVYEESKFQPIDYEVLLPYCRQAQFFRDLFDEHIQKPGCELNIVTQHRSVIY